MKKMNKLFTLALAIVMILSLAAPVFAAETTYSLTIKNPAPNHTYDAYQIFAGTLSTDQSTLSDIVWGNGMGDAAAFVTALTTDETPIPTTSGSTSLKAIFAAVAGVVPEKQAAKVAEILGTVSNDSSTLDRFAELLGTAVKDGSGNYTHTYLNNTPTGYSAAHAGGAYVISNLPAGYYLIKDRDGTQEGKASFYTKYIVRLVKSDEVQVKGGNVTVEKEVNDVLTGDYDDYKDFDVNQTAYFKWTGAVASNIRQFDNYWYKFTDTMALGLTFDRIESIYIENHNDVVTYVFYDAAVEDAKVNEAERIYFTSQNTDTTVVTGTAAEANQLKFKYQAPSGSNGAVLTLEFEDLLKLYPNILSTDRVVVKYSTYVNRDALIKDPNTNTVYLEFSNNPSGEGSGKTVPDVAHAFTFDFTVDKYDMTDPTQKLNGVEFLLYYRATNDADEIIHYYAQVVTEEMIAVGTPINGKAVDGDDLGLVYGWTDDRTKASVLDTDSNGAFHVKGLDEGTYFLEEIATVNGYNLLDTPVQIDIIPTYNVSGEEVSATVEYKVDSITQGDNGVVGIRNSKGATLPSTGGMGTTLFYLAGSVMVIGAGVLLITKKRMAE